MVNAYSFPANVDAEEVNASADGDVEVEVGRCR